MSVGVDIGSKSIKIVELTKAGNKWALRGSGVVGYSGMLIENAKDDKDLTGVATVLRRLHKEARISSKSVSISLPERSVFTRTINFPLLTDQEIDSAVKWESEQYIPIPISEAVVRHQIIRRNETATPPQVDVLLVAVKQTIVEKYIRLFQMAGLVVSSVETELMALVRALAPLKSTAMIVDFGAMDTNLAIAQDGKLVFSRSIPTGGDALTRSITQGFGIEAAQAEEYKKTYGLSSVDLEGKVRQSIYPVFKAIVDEIKKAVSYYQSDEKGSAPKQMIVSGGTSGLKDLTALLTKEFDTEIIVGNSFAKVEISPETYKQIANYSPLYAIAVGLALRED
jgi:type IV pilus assembly protein PilM